MRKSAAILISVLAAGPAMAEWRAMDEAEINAALTGVRLSYGAAWQKFHASGRTLYNAGDDSWGYWEAQGDKYCSQWPPAGGWACYRMERNEETGALRFIGESGDVTEGVPVE